MCKTHPPEMPKSDWIIALEIAIREADRYFIKMATRIRWQQALEALTLGPESALRGAEIPSGTRPLKRSDVPVGNPGRRFAPEEAGFSSPPFEPSGSRRQEKTGSGGAQRNPESDPETDA